MTHDPIFDLTEEVFRLDKGVQAEIESLWDEIERAGLVDVLVKPPAAPVVAQP